MPYNSLSFTPRHEERRPILNVNVTITVKFAYSYADRAANDEGGATDEAAAARKEVKYVELYLIFYHFRLRRDARPNRGSSGWSISCERSYS
jgi:hypothetical protein